MQQPIEPSTNLLANPIIAFACGAAIGATVMALVAPTSGRRVRAQIAHKANDIKDQMFDWSEMAADKAVEWKDAAVITAQDTMDTVGEALHLKDGKHAVEPTRHPAKV